MNTDIKMHKIRTSLTLRTLMKRIKALSNIAAVIIGITCLATSSPRETALAAPSDQPLIQQSDIVYQGAFRVPVEDNAGCNSSTYQHCFWYGGYALSYNPERNSLFFGGHVYTQTLGEISIPSTISLSSTATVLQNLADPTEGNLGTVGPDPKLYGSLVYNNRLIVTGATYYGPSGNQLRSHGASGLNLSNAGDFQGFYSMNSAAGPRAVSGWMTTIPPEWQPLLGGPALTGHCCTPGNQDTSNGPAATIFNPDDVGVKNPIPGTTLIYYPFPDHPIARYDTQNLYYNLATVIRGIAFPQGSRSVLFFGRQGTGPYCYGEGGVSGQCYDPVDSSKGTHAYPYRYQVWAYDANDLLLVKNGQKQSWEIMPYAVWELTGIDSTGSATISGAAYDSLNKRVFITTNYGDNPIVHVYKINIPGATPPPAAPKNLRTR